AARTPRGAATSAPASTEVRTSSAPPRPEHPARAERPEGRGEEPGPDARQRLSSALLRFVPTVPASHTGRTQLDPWPNWSCAHFEWIAGGLTATARPPETGPFFWGFRAYAAKCRRKLRGTRCLCVNFLRGGGRGTRM